jgi:polyphosphate kinase 2 (PPK2 family)
VRVNPAALAAQNLPGAGGKGFWEGRFESIREFEQHLARNGTVVVKFWLNVSRKEQKKRLLERIADPEKNWKFRLGDLDDRARWGDFQKAYEAMLRATSRPWAPWYAIPADDKDYMRAAVASILVETLERIGPRYPAVSAAQRRELAGGRRRLLAE